MNNCIIKNIVYIPFASACVEENYAQTRTFSNTPFKFRGKYFLVHGTKIRLTRVSCISVRYSKELFLTEAHVCVPIPRSVL